jgi:inner membrane transporter RhtA
MVLGAVLSVQIGSAFAKGLFPQVGPAGAVWLRLALAAALLIALTRPRFTTLRGRSGRVVVLFGLTLAGMNWSFYEALARIPLGVAVTIEFVGPLGVAVAASRRRSDVAVAGLAAAGILLLTRGSDAPLDLTGVALALLAGGFWAAYILLSAAVGASGPGAGGLAIALLVGGVATAPAGLVSLSGSWTWTVLGVGAGVALLSSVVPYTLELEALRRIPTAVFGVLLSLEPAAAAVAGRAILGEELIMRQWFAILLVVVATALAALRSPPAPTGLV